MIGGVGERGLLMVYNSQPRDKPKRKSADSHQSGCINGVWTGRFDVCHEWRPITSMTDGGEVRGLRARCGYHIHYDHRSPELPRRMESIIEDRRENETR